MVIAPDPVETRPLGEVLDSAFLDVADTLVEFAPVVFGVAAAVVGVRAGLKFVRLATWEPAEPLPGRECSGLNGAHDWTDVESSVPGMDAVIVARTCLDCGTVREVSGW